ELDRPGNRLEALNAGDPTTDVRTAFASSYAALTPPAARLFRLLGLHPGPDLALPAAASLSGHPLPLTQRLLADLVQANLYTDHHPARSALHALPRAYSRDLVRTDGSAASRAAATTRLLDYYTHTAYAAARLLDPYRHPNPLPLAPAAAGITSDCP